MWKYSIAALLIALLLSATPLFGAAANRVNVTPVYFQNGGATTQLVLSSDSEDSVGGGLKYFYGSTDGVFSAQAFDFTGDGLVDYVTIRFRGHNRDWWDLSFGTNGLNRNIAVGIYNRSERAPFASQGHAGMDISGQGRGCDEDVGRFAILDAKFDYSSSTPRLVSFAAEFEQHCEGRSAALIGTIYLNSTPTTSLSLNPSSVLPGGVSTGIVSLSMPAPANGAVVSLMSVDDAAVKVPRDVFIPAQETAATFTASTTGVNGPRSVPVLALYNGTASFAVLRIVPTASPLTMLSFQGHGDYIAGSATYFYSPADGRFDLRSGTSRSDNLIDTILLLFNTPGFDHFWSLAADTAELNAPLAVGVYPNAQRWPFEAAGHPGFDLSGDGRGCNTLTGNFTVLDASFDYTFSPAKVISFAIEFEQHCEGWPPFLTGVFYYNFVPPQPAFDNCLKSDDGSGLLQINSGTGAYLYTNCSASFTLSGMGTVHIAGGTLYLTDSRPDRKVNAGFLLGQHTGDATIYRNNQGVWQTFRIHDSNPKAPCSCSTK